MITRTDRASRLLRGLRLRYASGSRLTSTFDSATGITTAYTYKPNTNYIQTETSVTSAPSVVSSYSYTYRADGLKTGRQ